MIVAHGGGALAQVSDLELQAAYCIGQRDQIIAETTEQPEAACQQKEADAARNPTPEGKIGAYTCRFVRNRVEGARSDAAHLRAYLAAKGSEVGSSAIAGEITAYKRGQHDEAAYWDEALGPAMDISSRKCRKDDASCNQRCISENDITGMLARMARCNDILKRLPF